ncbi:hypothetical protein PIB30_089087 [Stylosanthes scabra]|uniref:ATP-dependent RNA helicase n=1 Tax=Stylosanthes scabra TaxID=79078 RepID=A0ABU6TUK8_9FABA|nr:hypothetical protein [Stylosanthes scabra]
MASLAPEGSQFDARQFDAKMNELGIVPFIKELDVIQQAQFGTGKTATFCSGILQELDYTLVECHALVLAPTCELAQQIEKVMRALSDYLGVKVHTCVLLPQAVAFDPHAILEEVLSLFSGKSKEKGIEVRPSLSATLVLYLT